MRQIMPWCGVHMIRAQLIDRLTELIAGSAADAAHDTVRVAIDGPDTAGKTTMADELADALRGRRAVIRAGIDGFHRPRVERVRRGELSPDGYFADSFDNDAVIANLLAPLGVGGDRRYRTAVFDYRADQPVTAGTRQAPPDAVLLFDGVFLLRPELRPYWDVSIFLEVGADEILRRAVDRDGELFGGDEVTRLRYTSRYLPGQRLYREQARPADVADIVLNHEDPANPVVLRWDVRPVRAP